MARRRRLSPFAFGVAVVHVVAAILIFGSLGCKATHSGGTAPAVKTPGDSSQAPKNPNDENPNLGPATYSNVRDRVLVPRCLECHKYVQRFDSTQKRLGRIESEIKTQRMPKGSRLPKLEEDLLLTWIAAGGPE